MAQRRTRYRPSSRPQVTARGIWRLSILGHPDGRLILWADGEHLVWARRSASLTRPIGAVSDGHDVQSGAGRRDDRVALSHFAGRRGHGSWKAQHLRRSYGRSTRPLQQ
jgi:hypothetical protein